MKRTLRLVGMAAMVLLLAASCKKEGKENGGKQMMTFSAGIVQSSNAKTGLIPEGNANGDDHYFKQMWLDNDKINVNGEPFEIDASSIAYSGSGVDGTCTATFNGLAVPTTDYFAIYPYNPNATLDMSAKTAKFQIPSVQSVIRTEKRDGNVMYQPAFAPMVAHCVAGAEQLDFTNLCGLLELRVSCPTDLDLSVTKIAVTATGGTILAGEWTYNFENRNFEQSSQIGQSNRVTMSFDKPVSVSTDASNPTSFLFVIPPVTTDDNNLNVYVYGNGSGDLEYVTITKITTQALQFEQGKVLYNKEALILKPVVNPACKNVKNNLDASSLAPVNGLYCEGEIDLVNTSAGLDIVETGFCCVQGSVPAEDFPEYDFDHSKANPAYHPSTSLDGNTFKGTITGLEENSNYSVVAYVLYKYMGNDKLHCARTGFSQTRTIQNAPSANFVTHEVSPIIGEEGAAYALELKINDIFYAGFSSAKISIVYYNEATPEEYGEFVVADGFTDTEYHAEISSEINSEILIMIDRGSYEIHIQIGDKIIKSPRYGVWD